MNQPSFRDLEQVSAYLDGQLSQADSVRLEARIQSDPELRSVYEGLRQSRAVLRKLPQRRAPRNFRLTPQMAGIKPPLPRAFPVFRLASAFAAILFFLGYALNLSAPLAASMSTAATSAPEANGAAPAIEMAVAATEALETPASKFAPPNDSDLTATADQSMTLQYSETEIAPQPDARSDPYNSMPIAAQQPPMLPIHPAWLFGFLALAVVSGVSAYIIRTRTEQNWAKANAAIPARLKARNIFLIALVVVVVLALVAALYWMSTDFSDGLGGDAGNVPFALAQEISITPELGYNFSFLDSQGMKTIIDFPENALKGATNLYFIAGLGTANPPGDLTYFDDHAFTIFPPPQSAQLQAPMTIRINYGDDVSSAVDENKLALYWLAGNQWLDAATSCMPASSYSRLPDSNQISVPICQFGTFLLAAP